MTDPDAWEQVGRRLAASEVDEHRFAIESALRELHDTIEKGGGIEPQQVIEVRRALQRAQQFNEEQLAPLADVEPWDRTLDRVPQSAIWRTLGYRPTDGEPIES